MTTAIEANASVRPGRMSDQKRSPQVLPQPDVGKMSSATPNTISSMRPIQKEGADRPMSANRRMMTSGSLSFLAPAR